MASRGDGIVPLVPPRNTFYHRTRLVAASGGWDIAVTYPEAFRRRCTGLGAQTTITNKIFETNSSFHVK